MQQKIGWMHTRTMIYEIETDDDYRDALKRFLEICKDPKDTTEVKEMYVLMDMMAKYERESCAEN
jgi:hypothetical protein